MVNMRVWPQNQRPANQFDRAGVLTLLVMEHAEQMQSLGVALLSRQNLLVQLRSGSQSPRSVHFNRGGEYVLHRPLSEGQTPEVSLTTGNSLRALYNSTFRLATDNG